MVHLANARTLRASERRGNVARGSRAVRVLTAYTTGTKTGTAQKTDQASVEKADAEIVEGKMLPSGVPNPCFGLESEKQADPPDE